jgi:DNA-binding XRE family transcriptional regulator
MAYQEIRTFEGLTGAIRQLRRRLGLTQAGLGHQLLVSRNTVNRYEHGAIAPSVHVLILLLSRVQTLEEHGPIFEALKAKGLSDSELAFMALPSLIGSAGGEAEPAAPAVPRSGETGAGAEEKSHD